jgi:sporulation protein YlmC with PRC-barrel domain
MQPVVREILDKQVVDRNQKKMGRVDAIVLELRKGHPPRLTHLEIGPVACVSRISRRLAVWIAALERRWKVTDVDPFQISWSQVRDIGVDVEVDCDATKTPTYAWEHWVRDHIIKRLPGA